MGLVNANLTDLALGLGGSDRRSRPARSTSCAGARPPRRRSSPACSPSTSLALPFWVGFGVLAVGRIVYVLAFGHVLAAGYGERVLWARWNRAARAGERAAERPVGEVV